MLYEFKCRATGSVVMTQPVAERLLAIIGKEPAPQGIVLPERMAEAIAALEAAAAADRAQPQTESEEDAEEDDDRPPQLPVSLAQRAWPLIDMLKAALAADREITWGV